ncbi:MAG: MarR family EPS-associated transcriptional regulator [Syntrophaceae bacterium]
MRKKENYETEESLMILREIGTNPQLSQRELSSRLGLSLGKINFLLKAMIAQGLVKAENFKNSSNKRAYLYLLTPLGMETKAKTTYRFLKRKIEEYEKLKKEIAQLKKEVDFSDPTNEGRNDIL